jgi:hypothetical protein
LRAPTLPNKVDRRGQQALLGRRLFKGKTFSAPFASLSKEFQTAQNRRAIAVTPALHFNGAFAAPALPRMLPPLSPGDDSASVTRGPVFG